MWKGAGRAGARTHAIGIDSLQYPGKDIMSTPFRTNRELLLLESRKPFM